MDKEKHIVSLELAKKLKELNIEQDSIFNYELLSDALVHLHIGKNINNNDKFYSAFISSELLYILPTYIEIKESYPYSFYRIRIEKVSLCTDENNPTKPVNNYMINYYCNSMDIGGADAFIVRKLCTNIFDENLVNSCAKMLIYLIENKLYEPR